MKSKKEIRIDFGRDDGWINPVHRSEYIENKKAKELLGSDFRARKNLYRVSVEETEATPYRKGVSEEGVVSFAPPPLEGKQTKRETPDLRGKRPCAAFSSFFKGRMPMALRTKASPCWSHFLFYGIFRREGLSFRP
ncbi:MAG TPA: hypothetical protein DEA63_03100 [Firmicutes bacterium]|nr:hypothetical protein [Bacillota bacterium]